MNNIGFETIASYEEELLAYATNKLREIPGLKIFGEAAKKTAVISFNIDGIHPYDIGSILDQLGIAVRTGHHCAQPIMDYYQIPGTVRASFAFYNTKEEIDRLDAGIRKAIEMLQ
jgi:cysteine desulfurase/selenocysteine lyase